MKSLLRFFILPIVVLAGLYVAACGYAKNNTDVFAQTVNRYSFMVSHEDKYVKIDNTNAIKDKYGDYTYVLPSYNKDGQKQEIKFIGLGKLKQDHYLKLNTTGTEVNGYKEVFPKDMPKKVVQHLVN